MSSADEKKVEEKVEAKVEDKKQEDKEEKTEKTEDKKEKDAGADPLQEFMDEGRKEKAANVPQPAVGDMFECRFPHPKGDRWFEAKVLEIVEKDGEEKKYKMEWQYDPDEDKSIVPVADLRKTAADKKKEEEEEAEKKAEAERKAEEAAAAAPFEPKVGDIVEARFVHPKGDRWFEAKVLEITKEGDEEKYKMEWQYDPDEEKSMLPIADLRKVGSAKAAAAGAKPGGAKPWAGGASKAWEPETKKRKVEYVVSDAEAEKRRKRAARFGVPEQKAEAEEK